MGTLRAGAQTETPASLFSVVHTDASFVIRQHSTGADLVEVTMLSPTYPAELLSKQIQAMCAQLGTPARGLAINKNDLGQNLSFLKATFATNGIIDRAHGTLRIQPILRAFAGAPAPYTLTGLSIVFSDEAPSTKTLQKYKVANVVESEARYSTFPPGIEYRIKLLTQDPSKITFPDKFDAPPAVMPPKPAPQSDNRGLIVGLFAIAGLALGALVYFALLKTGSRARRVQR